MNGIKAYSLEGGLVFSGTTFTASMNPSNLGTVTGPFSGTIRGFVFSPLGCEQVPQGCTGDGPQVFIFHVTGSATITLSGEIAGNNGLVNVSGVNYNVNGVATVVPEPSAIWLLGTGISGIGVFRYRYFRRFATKR